MGYLFKQLYDWLFNIDRYNARKFCAKGRFGKLYRAYNVYEEMEKMDVPECDKCVNLFSDEINFVQTTHYLLFGDQHFSDKIFHGRKLFMMIRDIYNYDKQTKFSGLL